MKLRKIQNKKGASLKMAFFALIAFSVVIIAIGQNLAFWDSNYGTGMTSDLGEFNKLDDVSSVAQDQKGSVSPGDDDPGDDPEASTFKSVFGILTNIFTPFKVVFGQGGMLDSLQERLGIPDYIIQAIATMMIISLTFTIIAIIFRLGKQ